MASAALEVSAAASPVAREAAPRAAPAEGAARAAAPRAARGAAAPTCSAPSPRAKLAAPLFAYGGYTRAVKLEPTEHRLYAYPPVVSAGLGFVTTVRLEGTGANLSDGGSQSFVEALPVTGTVTEGVLEASGVDPGGGALVAVLLSGGGTRLEVSALTVTGGAAHFTPYASVNPPSAQYLVSSISPYAPGQFLVAIANGEYTLTLSGGTATWGPPIQPMGTRYPEARLEDGARSRLVGFGERSYQGTTPAFTLAPTVFTRALPTGAWTEVATSGDGPPTLGDPQSSYDSPWAAWDEAGQRLIASVAHQINVFGQLMWTYGLWSCDLSTGSWSKLADDIGQNPIFDTPLFDAANDQLLMNPQPDWLQLLSVRPATAGQTASATFDGLAVPESPIAAAALPDGRVVGSRRGALYAMTAADPVWRRFTAQAVPDAALDAHSLSFDAKTGKLLLYGGSLSGVPSGNLYDVALDGSGFTPLGTTGAPPARSGQSSLAADGTLYVVGGDGWSDVLGARHRCGQLEAARRAPRRPEPRGARGGGRRAVGGRRGERHLHGCARHRGLSARHRRPAAGDGGGDLADQPGQLLGLGAAGRRAGGDRLGRHGRSVRLPAVDARAHRERHRPLHLDGPQGE